MPRAASLATTLLEKYTHKIENIALIPAHGGRFEVSIDGTEVCNKKVVGQFPELPEIIKQVEMRV